ncbi:MAG TPA: NAD(P)(+) transhydrogenase (Re/Si-specific) subunit alpha, partial [Thermoanaerobaculia bacterium]|nr:NAD(P)(+) transhydrogenase (Re/Si-specific) subunit alpha [Thermoanaerobaculia bacterium]
MANVFIPRERRPGETRVAATPDTVRKMIKLGLEVTAERGAGESSAYPDADYETAGARLTDDPGTAAESADVILTVRPLEADDAAALKPGAVLIGLLAPHQNLDLVRALAERKVTSLAMELIPRITRAQSMDALSSQA